MPRQVVSEVLYHCGHFDCLHVTRSYITNPLNAKNGWSSTAWTVQLEPSVMVEAYIHDGNDSVDLREPHNSGTPVSLEELSKLGVFYRYLDTQEDVDNLAKERNYKNRDIVNISPASFPDEETLKAKLDIFYKEHLHEDEEIRYCLDGEGYFDVRNTLSSDWIRIRFERNDLLIVPAGIFHRFTLTSSNYVKALRLFQDEPKWLAINKPEADLNPTHLKYVESVNND